MIIAFLSSGYSPSFRIYPNKTLLRKKYENPDVTNDNLTEEEKKVLDWLEEQRESGRGRIPFPEFRSKVEDVVGCEMQEVDEERFRFNLVGVTVTLEDGKKMYPIRDLEEGITRGYSTD